MNKVIILPPEPPIQTMMNHIFDRYRRLSTSCSIKGIPVDIKNCVRCCADSYFNGESEYTCENFRKVYLIKYLAVQVEQINWPIKVHLLSYIWEKSTLTAISLGGGPGTEAIALINNLTDMENFELTHDNVDAVDAWKTMYEDITHWFAKQIEKVKLKTKFISYDFTSASYNSDQLYDIVFVSWILSQINRGYRSRVLEIARNLVKPQGYVLVTDRTQDTLVENITTILNEVDGLTWIKKEEQLRHNCGITFPSDIKDDFQVRILCNSTYWLLQSSGDEF